MAFITPSNPFFIKVIQDQTLVQAKIDIPKRFVTNNGGGGSLFHKAATLCLPCGAVWEVQVQKYGGKVSFSRGLPDFFKFYSVRSGYFIIFKLVGNSCFDVSIIDRSEAEIDYPIKLQTFRPMPKINNGGSSGLASSLVVKIESETDEETDSFRNMRKKIRKNRKQLTVDQRFSDEDDDEYDEDEDEDEYSEDEDEYKEDEDEEEDEDLVMDFSKRQSNVRGSGSNHGDDDSESMRRITTRKKPQPLTKNQEQILRLARMFKCNRKNPSFMVTMRPSYIQTGFYLSLPRSFADRYVKESMDVRLELDDGRVWSVWCGVRWALTRRRTEFKGGWKAFTLENELHDGDTCVFEWISKSSIVVVFRVTIFRRPLN